ncbi:invasion associated locus B family protein [Sphingomonas sp. PB4P5]|uniref:invasion associated locus B family protein n=1 Tax=Parasphingomonas puruogangriensis TaxID=3096155 RepID=UPI002FC6AB47
MKRALLLALLVAAPLQAKESLGVFERWGAFSDAAPRRCYAIAQPVQASAAGARWRPFASIATWPGRGARNQLHIRLSRERDARARVTLSVGERRFALVAGNADAWAPDKRTDAAVVAAIRSGRSMSVESLSKSGQPFADVYALRGAATAIDAASLGCTR